MEKGREILKRVMKWGFRRSWQDRVTNKGSIFMFSLYSWVTALLISDDLTQSLWVWLMAATDGGANEMTEVSCFLVNVGSF